jgi:N-acetyl-anhydromuramyl-L-alanine amidase AmpD
MNEVIKNFQHTLNETFNLKLQEDGILGPIALGAIAKVLFQNPEFKKEISKEINDFIINNFHTRIDNFNFLYFRKTFIQSPVPSIPMMNKFLKYKATDSRNIKQIILHHDCTNSALQTLNVFLSKGVSSHGVINFDGVFYQFCDFINITYHATGHIKEDNAVKTIGFNSNSIGIDLNNPVYDDLKSDRPRIFYAFREKKTYNLPQKDSKKLLGLYPVQITNACKLISWIVDVLQLKDEFADYKQKYLISGKIQDYEFLNVSPDYPGIFAHHHISLNREYDPIGFDWTKIRI